MTTKAKMTRRGTTSLFLVQNGWDDQWSLWEPSSSECLGLKCVDSQCLIQDPAGATGENKHASLSPIVAERRSFLHTEQLSLPPASQCLTNVVRSLTFMIYAGELQGLMKNPLVLDATIHPPAFSQWNKQIQQEQVGWRDSVHNASAHIVDDNETVYRVAGWCETV